MEQFRQRIMKDLLELEEAAFKEKPKKVISEEGNVKTIHCDGDPAVVSRFYCRLLFVVALITFCVSFMCVSYMNFIPSCQCSFEAGESVVKPAEWNFVNLEESFK